MAKIEDSRPVGLRPVATTQVGSSAGGVRPVAPQGGPVTVSARPVSETGATATVMGIPEVELTPRVRDAIMRLMGEVDQLRTELNRTRNRLAELERLADRDTLTPLYNRRAFVRELSRSMAHVERYNRPSCLIYFETGPTASET